MLLLLALQLPALQLQRREHTACRCCPPAPHTYQPAASALAPALQGDNNWGDDRSLYPKGQLWLNRGHIMGKVVG